MGSASLPGKRPAAGENGFSEIDQERLYTSAHAGKGGGRRGLGSGAKSGRLRKSEWKGSKRTFSDSEEVSKVQRGKSCNLHAGKLNSSFACSVRIAVCSMSVSWRQAQLDLCLYSSFFRYIGSPVRVQKTPHILPVTFIVYRRLKSRKHTVLAQQSLTRRVTLCLVGQPSSGRTACVRTGF
jgi:hypothetical protein